MTGIEHITDDAGRTLAIFAQGTVRPDRTSFVTADGETMQLGFVVYPAGGAVTPHRHRPIERRLVGTAEVILVRTGRCIVTIYDEDGAPVADRELTTGDTVLLLAGGHGFEMLEDTVLLEVKQGPYTGLDEKEQL